MRIYEKDDGTGTFLATNTAADTNEGVWYEMRIVADGANLKVYRGAVPSVGSSWRCLEDIAHW